MASFQPNVHKSSTDFVGTCYKVDGLLSKMIMKIAKFPHGK